VHWRLLTLVTALGLVLTAGTVSAQSLIERMVMPGPLSRAHATLESVCTNCHRAFSKEAQSALCVGCHKDIATDAATHTHFHGRSAEVTGSQCRRCHAEHQGRDASIIFSTPELLDHGATDFALTGAHVGVACGRCHAPKASFRAARTECHACHAKDDPHKGALGTDCAKCHVTERWSRTAPWPHLLWPLLGAHKQAACHACHAGPRFVGLPKTCIGCHRQDDVHRAALGPRCDACHSPTGWLSLRKRRSKH
jgi:hypothetical protein